MKCRRCHREFDPAEHTIDFDDHDIDTEDIPWCPQCVDAICEELHEERPPAPTPLPDGTRVEGCEMIWYQLPNGQRFAVWISGNTLLVGHDLIDMPASPHGRTAEGDLVIVPGKPLKAATIDYQRPSVPSPN